MEEGKDKISLSRDDLIALSQEFSDRDVRYSRLELMYQMEVKKNQELESKLTASESARKKAEEDAQLQKSQNEQLKSDIDTLKAKIASIASSMQRPDVDDVLQQTKDILLQEYLLLSIQLLQKFMKNVTELNTALALRAFVLECVPEQLKPAAAAMIGKVMTLPDKPKPIVPVDNRTINLTGNDATYNENPKNSV